MPGQMPAESAALPEMNRSVYPAGMTHLQAPRPAPEIKQGRKFEQVLAGAREVFMADGFERGSVDEIARRAGVSKATLYSYFPDKRLLFLEVVRQECLRQADAAEELTDTSAAPAVVLRRAARRLVEFYLSDFAQAMHRLCVSEAYRFPELGRQFYESGPLMGRQRIEAYLRAACARRQLDIDDFALAADQFVELCKADLFTRVVCNMVQDVPEEAIERVVDGAVETFLARYGGSGGGPSNANVDVATMS